MLLTKYFVLVFLPAIAYATITIKITAGKNKSEASIEVTGEDKAVISDEEQKTFQLDHDGLKEVTKTEKGQTCTDVNVKSPTNFGDLYTKYGWAEVQRILKPVGARILNINTEPVVLGSAKYTNHLDKTSNYTRNINTVAVEYINHTWREDGKLTVKKEINYDINFGAESVGGMIHLRYTSPFGLDKRQDRIVTIGPTSNVAVSVPPKTTVREELYAIEGTMDIEIDYVATVKGDVFCNYYPAYKQHHFYAWPVGVLQKYGNLPKSVTSIEKIRVGFYTNSRVELLNDASSAPIKEVDGGIVEVIS